MVRLEVELLGQNIQNEIYELRNYLRENLQDVELVIKEQPLVPGQMSLALVEPIVTGVLHSVVALSFEELYRNLLKPLLLTWLKSRKEAGIQLEVMSSLSGSNEKAHFLEDTNGNSQVYNFKYKIDPDKTFVLLIGVGKFTHDFNPIPPVEGNLEDFCRLLINKKHIGIPRENIVISYNESHLEIQRHLLQAGRRPNVQTLIVYFAGHGHRTDVKKLSLIASDTEKIGDEIIGGVDFDFISNKVMKNSAATQKILILDTCHSGIATQGADDIVPNFDVKGSYILTSSPGDDVSYFEKNARHTFFTGALLDVLENGIDNTNDMLALGDIYDYAREALSEKKFPHPNAKSELNIPPSDFFIANNPSFSSEKLKWRAYNLFRDGKLEEALDELRKLLKRFPDDSALRKQFEECETELSFSKLTNQANTLFYGNNDFKQAAAIYRRAYELKKDALIMEKIRLCEQKNIVVPEDPLTPVKDNVDFRAFQKAFERSAFYTAFQYLKRVRKAFPGSDYIRDELLSLENKLKNIAEGKNDERLTNYYHAVRSGDLQQALAELKVQVSNDPEYPVFLQLQQALLRRIRDQKNADKEEKIPLLFRIFQTLGKKWKVLVLLSLAALLTVATVIYFRNASPKTLADLRSMLVSNPEKAVTLLKDKARDDDSAKLVLGDYYRQKGSYDDAFLEYSHAILPAAKASIGEMYVEKQLRDDNDAEKAKQYFEKALLIGDDTTASTELGVIALRKYVQPAHFDLFHAFFTDANWSEAEKNFKEGYRGGSVASKQMLSKIYYEKGKKLYADTLYDQAHDCLISAIKYENSDAMVVLGHMFSEAGWRRSNADSTEMWYRDAAAHENPAGLNNYASVLIHKGNNDPSNYDNAYNLLLRAKEADPSAAMIYFHLAEVFQHGGYHIYQNNDSAIHYYHIAADKGRQDAQDSVRKLEASSSIFKKG